MNENKIELIEDAASLSYAFASLEHIVLGKIYYTWENVMSCVGMWKNLCELQVPWNNMTSLTIPPDSLKIQSLDLEGNPIEDWDEINKLGCLER
ncbi:hypothetical protein J437_LFUL005243 [Ladona fulva]|uniref:Uncharacterized protein n=1 Tax=Ladona fulva TaxID=123851 RepID=A0A8K0NWL2_LADFU|nr:hypothetical protein J437_LFUL005243 [Ladona fulva]